MLASKMIRLVTKCDLGSRVTNRFLRIVVPVRHRESKRSDPSEVNDVAQQEIIYELSPKELMMLSERDRKFLELGEKIHNLRGADYGIDNPQVMEIQDEMDKLYDDPRPPAWLKGKPSDLDDSIDQEASGHRIFNATEALLAKHGKSVKGLTFSIQGFGNVGSSIARLVHGAGGKAIAMSDSTGAVKNEEGIDIIALLKHMDSKGNSLADFSGGDSIDAVELLFTECDVLVLAALGRALKCKAAADVKAKFVIDTADRSIGMHNYEILARKGVVTLHSIYEKAGDRTLGYLGWQKALGFAWVEAEPKEKLDL